MKNPPHLLTLALTLLTIASCHPNHLSNTQLGDWLQSAAIGNYPRSNASCFVLGDKAYIGLGYNENIGGQGRLKDFWRFSVDSGWRQLQDFPGAARSHAATFALGNYGYVGTGYDGFNTFSDFYQYDPVQNQWTVKASVPGPPRYDGIGFGIQGKGYIGTGFNVYWMNDLYQYDPQSDRWVLAQGTSDNFSKRRGAMTFIYQEKAYIVGGSNNNSAVRDFWQFDPSQPNPWKRLHDITNNNAGTFDDGYKDIVRQNGVAFVNGTQAFITTGINVSMVSSTWAYDFVNDAWSQRSPYPRQPRFGAVGFTISGKSFVGTGNAGSSSTFDDFEQFLPLVPFNANDN